MVIAEVAPLLQVLMVGALVTVVPLAAPQTPLTGVGVVVVAPVSVVPVAEPLAVPLLPLDAVVVPVPVDVLPELPISVPAPPLVVVVPVTVVSAVPPILGSLVIRNHPVLSGFHTDQVEGVSSR